MRPATLPFAAVLLAAPSLAQDSTYSMPINVCRNVDNAERCVVFDAGAAVGEWVSSDIPPDYAGNLASIGIGQKDGSCMVPCESGAPDCDDRVDIKETCTKYPMVDADDQQKEMVNKAVYVMCKYDTQEAATANSTTCALN